MQRLALAYHAVSDAWRDPLAVSPAVLRRQLVGLAERGFRGATLSELGRAPGDRLVAVTFDDGFASVATAAKAVLDELGWPGTVYLVTEVVGSGEPMRHLGAGDPDDGARMPLTWEATAALASAGWEIGSHTRTHRLLSRLSDGELREELAGSRDEVRRRVGACASVSYPFGELDDRVIAAARAAGYTSGTGLAGRFRRRDPLAVPRVAIGAADDELRFAVKTSRPFAFARTTFLWTLADAPRRARRPERV